MSIFLHKLAYAVMHAVSIVVIEVVGLKVEALVQLGMRGVKKYLCGNISGLRYEIAQPLARPCTDGYYGYAELL